jgi:hypothetical protein
MVDVQSAFVSGEAAVPSAGGTFRGEPSKSQTHPHTIVTPELAELHGELTARVHRLASGPGPG